MHKLVFLILIMFIYTVSLLLASYTENYFFIINFCAIPIVISGYFFTSFAAVLLLLFCCGLTLTYILTGASALNIFASMLLFVGCGFLAVSVKQNFLRVKTLKEDMIKALKDKFSESVSFNTAIADKRRYFESKVSEISNLYYSVKKMGSCSSFEDLLGVLRDTITERFKFLKCRLIILNDAQGVVVVEKIYNIAMEKIEQAGAEGYEQALFSRMLAEKQPLVAGTKSAVKSLGPNFSEDLNNFIAAPVISQGKIKAILMAENIEIEHKDDFAVVVNQFSMAFERIRLYELVQELAITDDLTKVFVRRHIMERLNEELARADAFHVRAALLMIDIDRFKEYNDKHGHLKGDQLLKEIASRLKGGVREIDIVGRYGGEEFCVILPEADSKAALLVAERLRENVALCGTTISIGLAAYPDNAKNSINLIEKADTMLYKAKKEGRNRVCVYEN